MPVKSITWPFSVVDTEHVAPLTTTMFVEAGSQRHPWAAASGSVLQHTGAPPSPAPGLSAFGGTVIVQPTEATSANRTTIEGGIAGTVAAPRVARSDGPAVSTAFHPCIPRSVGGIGGSGRAPPDYRSIPFGRAEPAKRTDSPVRITKRGRRSEGLD